jgi:DNA polymerase-4
LLGEREGAWLDERVRGIDAGAVTPRSDPKSISRDETFSQDLDSDEALNRELLRLAARAAGDLRSAALAARTITVRIRDADFTDRQASRTISAALVADRAVMEVARPLLARLRAARRVPARLLGVALSQFVPPDGGAQLGLFEGESGEPIETARDRAISRALDDVRERFGKDALGWAGES